MYLHIIDSVTVTHMCIYTIATHYNNFNGCQADELTHKFTGIHPYMYPSKLYAYNFAKTNQQ